MDLGENKINLDTVLNTFLIISTKEKLIENAFLKYPWISQEHFNNIRHKILQGDFEDLGIYAMPVKWFHSNLRNRRQFMSSGNVSLALDDIVYGVPQGSKLGPLLFLVYVNRTAYSCQPVMSSLSGDDPTVYFTNHVAS